MPRVAPSIPPDNALLCEFCGYNLTGLSADGRCPECGRPIADSLPRWRCPTAWERIEPTGNLGRFFHTSAAVLFHPKRFYRTLATRLPSPRARSFARIHLWIAAILFGTAAAFHLDWFLGMTRFRLSFYPTWPALILLCGWFLAGTIYLAARLTAWEAAYRGLRLPLAVVQRGMNYHTIHYLPAGLVAMTTVLGYQWLLRHGYSGPQSGTTYLYILCGEIILAAGYLFQTYWVAMRNMMYANA